MSLPKLRDLDKFGVITDVDSFDLPMGAWSMAINARFQDGRITSAPVWRTGSTLSTVSPRFVLVANKASNTSQVFVGYANGNTTTWTPTLETPVNVSGFSPAPSEAVWSGCTLADVVYVNREDRVPWAMLPSGASFIPVTGWNSAWRAKILRSYNSAVHAFNVTKGGVRYPTMIKSSDIVGDPGVQPGTWDETLTTANTAENILTEMNGEILDATTFGSALLIYSSSEVWEMQANGSTDIYGYRRLPFNTGVINANCVVTVANKQYGFGPDDIWMHDGIQQVSIAAGKVRKFIFATLNASASNRFFVNHDPVQKTIGFHYVSGDEFIAFSGTGCNRIAVFNYSSETWTFDDAPLVFASGYANFSLNSQTWASTSLTWDNAGGSWQDLEDGFKRATIYAGEVIVGSPCMWVRDTYGKGSSVSSAVDANVTKGFLLLREGIDLDDLGADLSGYKHIRVIYPQGRLEATAQPVSISFGVSDYAGEPPVYSVPQTWNAADLYWCDFTAGGRYLSIKATYPDFKSMSLSGFDVDIELTGER